MSAVSLDAIRDRRLARASAVTDSWDEEFDRGKVGLPGPPAGTPGGAGQAGLGLPGSRKGPGARLKPGGRGHGLLGGCKRAATAAPRSLVAPFLHQQRGALGAPPGPARSVSVTAHSSPGTEDSPLRYS